MKLIHKKPTKDGDYLLALHNSARNESFFSLVTVKDRAWLQYRTDEPTYYGPHISIIGYKALPILSNAKLTESLPEKTTL